MYLSIVNGRGNGLFHTTQFVRENNGTLRLYSGNYNLQIENGQTQIKSSPFWKGTVIYVRLNSDIPVSLNKIFGDENPISVDEYYELINGLW